MNAGLVASLVGLSLDIAGATLLVTGLLVRDMTIFRALGKEADEPWWKKIPGEVAVRFGS